MKIFKVLKPSRKKLIILIILITFGFLGFRFFGQKKHTPLQFADVKKQDIKSTVSSSGNLTGKDTVNLKFKSAGKLAYINVKVGDKVSKGQTIASLDIQDLNIALQQAQNTYRDKQATAQKIEDDVKDHSSDETFTQKATRTTAQAARDSAFDSIKAVQKSISDAVLVSPIDGIITQAIEISGQTVSTTDLIAQIVDSSSIYFDTDVDEADISKVLLGQQTNVSLDAYPNKNFEGIVDQILPQTKTTSSGATIVRVRIKLSENPAVFVNGLSGESQIIISSSQNVLTIPLEALREDNTVVLQTSNGLKPKKVTTGISSDTDEEITDGLSEGGKVLLNPPAPGSDLSKLK